VKHPSEIKEIFDAISYAKGASVIRMLEAFIGREVFAKGLQQYLNKHSWANASTSDLWAALEESSGKPVGSIMKNWTQEPGFPVLLISHVDGAPAGKQRVLIQQRRFLKTGIDVESTTIWSIPINVDCADPKENMSVLMQEREITLDLPSNGWVTLNPRSTGVYRVNYSPEMWTQLIDAIRTQSLPATDRLALQNDVRVMLHYAE